MTSIIMMVIGIMETRGQARFRVFPARHDAPPRLLNDVQSPLIKNTPAYPVVSGNHYMLWLALGRQFRLAGFFVGELLSERGWEGRARHPPILQVVVT